MGCSSSKPTNNAVQQHGSSTGTKSNPTLKSAAIPVTTTTNGNRQNGHQRDVTSTATTTSSSHNNVDTRKRLDSFASSHSDAAGGGGNNYDSDCNSSGGGTGNPMSGHHRNGSRNSLRGSSNNPKAMIHSTSKVGLDEMIEDRRADGNLRENVVHIEVPFGKPIEEVYDGIHTGLVLGSGISGTVRLVTHKATGIKYAVKVLDLGLVDNEEGLRQLREEIFIMCQLDHPNIVRLEEVYESQSEIYLVQELCLGGELFDRLDEQPDYHYTEAQCAKLVKQMLCAVRYLHTKGIIHRDLKLENFLFSSTSKDSELKMIDFGLSKHFNFGETLNDPVGTPYTVAPEVIKGSYDERCDVWAIGVITYLLLSGDPPFGGCGGPEPLMMVRSNILRGAFKFEPREIWQNVSPLAMDFIRDLLKVDPKDRPTAQQAQQHPWVVEWASRSLRGKDNRLNPNVVKALVNFKEFSDMRKLLCEVLSFTLLPYQIKELRREFEKMDTEGSGEISLEALKQVLASNAGAGSLGALTEEEVEDIFNAMRVGKKETKIHWHEFIAAGLSQCQVDDRNLRLAFDRLDSDHKGYIILDDIMDLMGSDAITSEDDMERMWGDGLKSVKGPHARITYDDFLLLMKGQTMENQSETARNENMNTAPIAVIPEQDEAGIDKDEKMSSDDLLGTNEIDVVDEEPQVHQPHLAAPLKLSAEDKEYLPIKIETFDSPVSMDGDDDDDDDQVVASGPGVPGTAASLTPPASPFRGAEIYATPGEQRRAFCELKDMNDGLAVPGPPFLFSSGVTSNNNSSLNLSRPPIYTRRRSRSLDEQDIIPKEKPSKLSSSAKNEESKRLSAVAEVVIDMILPEKDHSVSTSHNAITETIHDPSQTALVVNRKLYRAHRQMRLAVLEASKRFEEQQAQHAKEVIMAARQESESRRVAQAGLVMRHGYKKQVSSKSIRTLLERNRQQQLVFVEKANRSSGRGRRSRKKTVSDMSSMLTSIGTDNLTMYPPSSPETSPKINTKLTIPEESSMSFASIDEGVASSQISTPASAALSSTTPTTETPLVAGIDDVVDVDDAIHSSADDVVVEQIVGHERPSTIPGEFRMTNDPFGTTGRYGAVLLQKQKD